MVKTLPLMQETGASSCWDAFPQRRAFIWKQMFFKMFYSLSNTTKSDHSSDISTREKSHFTVRKTK